MNIEFSTCEAHEARRRILKVEPSIESDRLERIVGAVTDGLIRIGDPMMYNGQAPVFLTKDGEAFPRAGGRGEGMSRSVRRKHDPCVCDCGRTKGIGATTCMACYQKRLRKTTRQQSLGDALREYQKDLEGQKHNINIQIEACIIVLNSLKERKPGPRAKKDAAP
jgi:hypothetical protein